MAILKNVGLKTSTIDEIKDNFDGAQGVVVVNYSGLTVEQDTQLRKQLREAGVVYKVYKNTLVKRVVAGTEFEPITDALEGTNAIAFCKTDATAPARILANFAKTANALELKCGVVEGTFYDRRYRYNRYYPFKRGTSFKVTWKYPVTYYKLCSCY